MTTPANTLSRLWVVSPEPIGKKEDPRERYGEGVYAIQIPGANCPECGIWTRSSVYPLTCPEPIRKEIEATHNDTPCMAVDDLRRKTLRWAKALGLEATDFGLGPGSSLPPYRWNPPELLNADWYFPTWALVVSQRLADCLTSVEAKGVSFHQVMHDFSVGVYDEELLPGTAPECQSTTRYQQPAVRKSSAEIEESLPPFYTMHVEDILMHRWAEDNIQPSELCKKCGSGRWQRQDKIAASVFRSKCRKSDTLPARFLGDADVQKSWIFPDSLIVSKRALEALLQCNLGNRRIREVRLV